LSAGKLAYAPPLESCEIDQGKRSRHSLVESVASDPQRLESERDILSDVEVGKQGVMLKHHAESTANRLDPGNVFVLDQYPTSIRYLESREQPKRRGLSAPARAEQRQHLSSLQAQRDPIHRKCMIKALSEVLQAKKGHVHPVGE
jgi:hypothetical protein